MCPILDSKAQKLQKWRDWNILYNYNWKKEIDIALKTTQIFKFLFVYTKIFDQQSR